jgi:ABC-type Na+ transport system ATPase subunit NatA
MSENLAIETERLGRVYQTRRPKNGKGARIALNDVSLSARRGELFGPNGAGKTTVMPVTYWLELVRRTLGVSAAGRGMHGFAALAAWRDEFVLAVLIGITAALAAVAGISFYACERYAREKGLLDRTSNY